MTLALIRLHGIDVLFGANCSDPDRIFQYSYQGRKT